MRFIFEKKSKINKYNPDRSLVFMHVPKTSGSSLRQSLRNCINPKREIEGLDHSVFGDFSDFSTIHPSILKDIYENSDALPGQADFVDGHMSYSTLSGRYNEGQYITLMREPCSRILSHWLYWRCHTDEDLRPWGGWSTYVHHARESFSHFVSSRDVACQIDNIFARMLLWPHPLIPNDNFIDPKYYKIIYKDALAVISRFSYLDLLENQDLELNLKAWMGGNFKSCRVNEAMELPRGLKTSLSKEITLDVFNILDHRTKVDYELWRWLALRRTSSLPEILQRHAFMTTVERYAKLMN